MPRIKNDTLVGFSSDEEAKIAATMIIERLSKHRGRVLREHVMKEIAEAHGAKQMQSSTMAGLIRRTPGLGRRVISDGRYYYLESAKKQAEQDHHAKEEKSEEILPSGNSLSLGDFQISPKLGSLLEFAGAKSVEIELLGSDSVFYFSGERIAGSLTFVNDAQDQSAKGD